MDNFSVQVTAAVLAAIERSGQSVNAVAWGSGVPRTTLNDKLKRARCFNTEELVLLADYLQCDPSDFIPRRTRRAA